MRELFLSLILSFSFTANASDEASNQSALFAAYTDSMNITVATAHGKTPNGEECEVNINGRLLDFNSSSFSSGTAISRTKVCELENQRPNENTFLGYSADDNAFDAVVFKTDSSGEIREVHYYEFETKFALSLEGGRERSCRSLNKRIEREELRFRCILDR